jgi:phage terminase large subunit-like protein
MTAVTHDDLLTLRESFPLFVERYRIPFFEWQSVAFGEATRREFYPATATQPAGRYFVHPLAGVSVPRGNGKSFGAAAVGVWRLIFGPPRTLILSAALDVEGARVVMDHAKLILRSRGLDKKLVDVRADQLVVDASGSRWIVRSREHTASRGLHPDVVLYDEVGWAKDDELFASLLASQASCADPLMLVVSTVGRRKSGPLWKVKQMADEETAAR